MRVDPIKLTQCGATLEALGDACPMTALVNRLEREGVRIKMSERPDPASDHTFVLWAFADPACSRLEAIASDINAAGARCGDCGELLEGNYHDADGACIHEELDA